MNTFSLFSKPNCFENDIQFQMEGEVEKSIFKRNKINCCKYKLIKTLQNKNQMKKEERNPKSNRKEFNNYIVGKTLGQGTFGKVKLGVHKITGENVAIKILEKDKINDLADTERVLRQIHILKLIRHPFILQLYEIIETPKKLFLITDYMEKGELFQYIVKQKRIKEEQACKLFHQLLDGIQYLHKIGVVHRDLKPQNLLLDFRKNLKIVDFGLSNTYKKNDLLKTPCGSPCYAAPQMLKGQSYDPIKVDIWSSGIILFAMLCGYLPFEDNDNTSELYAKILKGQYEPHDSISASAKDLLNKIICVDTQKRYTIQQIRNHPWMKTRTQTNSRKGIVVGYNKIPIDKNILNGLKQFEIETEYASKCLEANRHNSITTAYYLSMKKFIREGGKTQYDLGSENFNEDLLQPNKRKEEIIDNFISKTEDDKRQKSLFLYNRQSQKQLKKATKPKKIDPRIQNSMNYGRITQKNKSRQKVRRQLPMENRLNRKYKEKFNKSLVSRSKDKLVNRSRINSSVNRRKAYQSNENHNISNIAGDQFDLKHKKTLSKKLGGQSIKFDTSKILKPKRT